MSLEEIYNIFRSCANGFSTDSRADVRDTLFIALKGDSFNGNIYAEMALAKGASFAIIDDPEIAAQDSRMILVPNTNTFLADLAAYHRTRIAKPVIAIGGSNGKTTTRDMTVALLKQRYTVSTNRENENNIFGVSYTLLRTTPEHDLVMLEIGSNHLGEHAALLHISSPDYILLTNNGKDHLGEYGSMEHAIEENFELYRYAKIHAKKVFVPLFEPDLVAQAQTLGLNTILFDSYTPLPGLDISFSFEDKTIHVPIFGSYTMKNISASIAIAKELDLSPEEIVRGLRTITPTHLRGEIIERNGNTLILDCYNANPSSMPLALESFATNATRPSAVILGDMHELGVFADAEHQSIVDSLPSYKFDLVILVGTHFKRVRGAEKYLTFNTSIEAKAHIDTLDLTGYEILVKGSRGEKLEIIFE